MDNEKTLCPNCCEYSKSFEIVGEKFCRNCLRIIINTYKKYPVKLPILSEDQISSGLELSDEICYQILSKKDHAAYHRLRVDHRVIRIPNFYRCHNLSCPGTVKLSDQRQVKCERCGVLNCYDCQAVHENGETCDIWKEKNSEVIQSRIDQKFENEEQIRKNEAIYCPSCGILVGYLRGGCDWIRCPACEHEICFRTKMSRWGPGGYGDTSGGCKCKIDGVTLCHPECNNCH